MNQELFFESEPAELSSPYLTAYPALTSCGVWFAAEPSSDNHVEWTERDRCGQYRVRPRTTLHKEQKCVFKWAPTTAASTTDDFGSLVDFMPSFTSSGPSSSCFGCGPGSCNFAARSSSSNYIAHISAGQQYIHFTI
ncbi:hypothetical protein KIN20_019385 [Parelaphostrongylus tenuis]|uniref:Uncharacterized protein n=1 Tax=Parelaphostrongylus tenuis TaxID=148309 RepID=A0AAD5MRI3_PARTN|nr:hypothetical protein KIN20_019385 [Parelaphostrongylus tenuis]